MRKEHPSKTLAKDLGLVGEDAVAVLLAAIGSRPAKSRETSSTTSSSKTKRLEKRPKSSKKPSESINIHSKQKSAKKLTLVDIKLRQMVMEAKPGNPHTLQEIADFVGVSRERIRQIEEVAIRKLRCKMHKIAKDDKIDLEEFQY